MTKIVNHSAVKRLQIPANSRLSRPGEEEGQEATEESEVDVIAARKSRGEGHCDHGDHHDSGKQK